MDVLTLHSSLTWHLVIKLETMQFLLINPNEIILLEILPRNVSGTTLLFTIILPFPKN